LPFKEKSFDIVYSYGVLHHIPEIDIAQQEIARVLLPEGKLIAMVYAKYSMNYLLSICLLRRMGLAGAFMLGLRPSGKVEEHLENARRMGIRRYLKMENFIHRNTDGPLNPYSKVYDLKEVREDFSSFRVLKGYKEFMHAPPLPVHRLPLTRLLGWHLWLHMAPVKEG
jgi:SAM-dependent methyltransferase